MAGVSMPNNPLLKLKSAGQSVWLDNLSRPLIQDGDLARLIREDGVSGITSNPVIFRNAMLSGAAYDTQIGELIDQGKPTIAIYETLAINDIQAAAGLLMPVFTGTGGADGFVSLEVSPHLARDTRGTVDEARRLWETVARPNVLIKIPGTDEGIPAIEECLASGVNINITLLFSLEAYRKVMEATFRALERRREQGAPLDTVASVASFFLSRIDTKVDGELSVRIASGERSAEARRLQGRAAVASAKLAYGLWKEMHAGDRWAALLAAGARVQRPLWASTSTKNPDYPDVMYVAPLIGPQTVNTMPEVTLDAFRDHGEVAPTVEQGLDEARGVMRQLAALGIDIDRVTDELIEEGIQKFAQPFDELLAALEGKRAGLAAAQG